MKVKIIKCHGSLMWYIKNIGQVFTIIEDQSDSFYKVEKGKYILKDDCEILKEEDEVLTIFVNNTKNIINKESEEKNQITYYDLKGIKPRIGDVVKIKSLDSILSNYLLSNVGGTDFEDSMHEFCEKEYTITHTSWTSNIKTEFYGLNTLTRHRFSKEMFSFIKRIKNSDLPKVEINDTINPNNYKDGKIDVVDFIEDKNLCFLLGNTVKCISRAVKKDTNKTIEDLEKAKWYLERKINNLRLQQGK